MKVTQWENETIANILETDSRRVKQADTLDSKVPADHIWGTLNFVDECNLGDYSEHLSEDSLENGWSQSEMD